MHTHTHTRTRTHTHTHTQYVLIIIISGSKVEPKESETLTQDDLEKDVRTRNTYTHCDTHCDIHTIQVDIFLKETDTIWMLDIPGVWVARDSEEASAVIESNAKYKEVVTFCCI